MKIGFSTRQWNQSMIAFAHSFVPWCVIYFGPLEVREEQQECEWVEGPVGAARLNQSAERIAHVISAHWTHRLFNWLHTACLLIAAGIETRFLRLRYADPLLRDIWILSPSTSFTKTAGLLSVSCTGANDTSCEYFLTATGIKYLTSSP